MQSRAEICEEMRKRLQERVPGLTRPDFVARHVRPLLGDQAVETGCKVEIVWNEGTPRMTLRYAFDDGIVVYGKVYIDGFGPTSYSLLRRLWQNGFGAGSAQRVPEPLGFCAEENLLLMRAARGRPLAALLLQEPTDKLLPGLRVAAGWLARLHAARLAGLPPEPACNRIKIFELADHLGKAAAGHPADSSALLEHLKRIRTLAPVGRLVLVPTHGQYTPANVFVDGSDVVVIDLDRLSLSDPAKDVAMFLSRAVSLRAKEAGRPEDAERLAREFMDAYGEHAPCPLENLPYYRALFALNAFAKCAKDHEDGDKNGGGGFEEDEPRNLAPYPVVALVEGDLDETYQESEACGPQPDGGLAQRHERRALAGPLRPDLLRPSRLPDGPEWRDPLRGRDPGERGA